MILISLFLLFDFIGRSIPSFFIVFSARTLWIPTFLRLVFYPLFILCTPGMSSFFQHDAWPFVFSALMALSNGYVGTLGPMFGPMLCKEEDRQASNNVCCLIQGNKYICFVDVLMSILYFHFLLLILYV